MKNFTYRAFILSLLILVSNSISFAQEVDLGKKGYSFITPQKAIYTHLYYLQPKKGQYKPDLAAKALMFDGDKQEKINLSIKLKQILDLKGLEVKPLELPDNPNYSDSITKAKKYILFSEYPDIYVKKYGDQWLYSKETVNNIPKLYDELFPFGMKKLLTFLPKTGTKTFLGLKIWQWYGILFILVVCMVVYVIFMIIFRIIINRIFKKYVSESAAKKILVPIAKPASLLMVVIAALILWPVLQFEVHVNSIANTTAKVLISLFAMIIVYRLVNVLSAYMMKAAKKTESTLDDQLVPLVSKTLKIFIVAIGIVFILQNFGFSITALIAGLSIGGLAIAFAAQDTLKNLFGSLMIFLDKPFQIGDWIIAQDIDGMVEEVGFRSTRVRTFKNSLVSVPNGNIANMTIDNMGLRVYRRYSTNITITYDTPPDLIESFTDGLKEIVKRHPHTRKDYFEIHLNTFGSHSLDILFYIFFNAETWSLELKFRHEINIAIMKLAEELGVRFAFPTSTIHIEEMPGQKSLTPVHSDNKDGHRRKIGRFINSLKGNKAFQRNDYQNKQQQQVHQNKPLQQPNKSSNQQKPQEHKKQEQKKPFHEQKSYDFSKDKRKGKEPEKNDKQRQQEVQQQIKQEKEKTQLIKKTIKKGKELVDSEIIDIAKDLKIEEAALRALIEVESIGHGFYANGKPTIRFEGHKFYKELNKKGIDPNQYTEKYPDIVYPRWTKKFYQNDEKEYERLEKAKQIDKTAAYLSTSWGLFNLSGQLYKECGFTSVDELVYNIYMTEKEHLEAFADLLKAKNLIEDIQNNNWTNFARKYNGPNFNRKGIDQKLQKAYERFNQLSKS
jgi:MscS family membrane protein